MKQPKTCALVCRVLLNAKTAKEFKEKIEDERRVDMMLDNLPVVRPIRRPPLGSVDYQHGSHGGIKGPNTGNKEEKVYIHNHLSFTVKYHKDAETEASRIVGSEGIPYRYYSGVRLTTCNPAAKCFVSIDTLLKCSKIDFQESKINWMSRWGMLATGLP